MAQVAEDDEQHGVPADVWSCLDVYPHGSGSNEQDSSSPAAVGPEVWATLMLTLVSCLELLAYAYGHPRHRYVAIVIQSVGDSGHG